MSETTAPDSPLFARLTAGLGLEVEDVALECGVSRKTVYRWCLGLEYPSQRYALAMVALFGHADARRVYAERKEHKAAIRAGRGEGRTLRAAARVLRERGLSILADQVGHEAERVGQAEGATA